MIIYCVHVLNAPSRFASFSKESAAQKYVDELSNIGLRAEIIPSFKGN